MFNYKKILLVSVFLIGALFAYNVFAALPVDPIPTLTFSVSPKNVSYGGGASLYWDSLNTSSCTASGDWSGTKSTSDGDFLLTNLISSKTYTLTCTGIVKGSVTKSVTVNVAPPSGDLTGKFSFTSNGTFKVPAGVKEVRVEIQGGAGGGGGAGNRGDGPRGGGNGGAGGSGWAYVPVTPGETIQIAVGGGGAGGQASDSGGESAGGGGGGGGASAFGDKVIAGGGGGGGGGAGDQNNFPGPGGNLAAGAYQPVYKTYTGTGYFVYGGGSGGWGGSGGECESGDDGPGRGGTGGFGGGGAGGLGQGKKNIGAPFRSGGAATFATEAGGSDSGANDCGAHQGPAGGKSISLNSGGGQSTPGNIEFSNVNRNGGDGSVYFTPNSVSHSPVPTCTVVTRSDGSKWNDCGIGKGNGGSGGSNGDGAPGAPGFVNIYTSPYGGRCSIPPIVNTCLVGNAINKGETASNDAKFSSWMCTNPPFTPDARCYILQSAPNLTAGAVTPVTTTTGVSQVYSAVISNLGNAATFGLNGGNFTSVLQFDYDSNHNIFVDTLDVTTPKISAGGNTTISGSYAFHTTGEYYVRACADESGSGVGPIVGPLPFADPAVSDTGEIYGTGRHGWSNESNERNNCGPWTKISALSLSADPIVVAKNSTGTFSGTSTIKVNNSNVSGVNFSPPVTLPGAKFKETKINNSTKVLTVTTDSSSVSGAVRVTASGTAVNGSADYRSSVDVAVKIMSGTLTSSASSCVIPLGSSSCNVTLSWSTTNPIGTSGITSSYPNPSIVNKVANGNSGSQSVLIPYQEYIYPYHSRTFYLYNNAANLAQINITSSCGSNVWNGSKCVVPAPATPANFTAAPGACGTNKIDLRWDASSGATSYTVRDNSTVIYPNGSGLSFAHTGLAPGSSHIYSIEASNATGTSARFTIPATFYAPFACALEYLDLAPTSCIIETGKSTCDSNAGWSVNSATSPNLYDATAGTVLSTRSYDSAWPVLVSHPKTVFQLRDGESVLFEKEVTSSCASDAVFAGGVCVKSVTTGTLNPAFSSCPIPSGSSTCKRGLSWNTVNPVGTSAITSNTDDDGNTVPPSTPPLATGNSFSCASASCAFTVPYAGRTFFLYNNEIELDSVTITPGCASDTEWDGTKCAPPASVPVCPEGTTGTPPNCLPGGGDDPVVNGVCSDPATHYDCSVGVSTNNNPNPSKTYWSWICRGSDNNITTDDANCSQSKGDPMTGTLTPKNPTCDIPNGKSNCTINFSWDTTNPMETSAVTSPLNDNGSVVPGVVVGTGNKGTDVPFVIPRGSGRAFFLYNNANLLDQTVATSKCADGTTWNGGEGKCLTTVFAPTVTFSANPPAIYKGQFSTLTWSSGNTTSCTASATPASGEWSGPKSIVPGEHTAVVSPTVDTTYELNCSGPGGYTPSKAEVRVTVRDDPTYTEN